MNKTKSKRHKIKNEMPETSHAKDEEHDLAYYIHDRVELMHQVFSVIKAKEFKVMAPDCVRNISIDDLQELCLEELLGISSKRLCAILDGAEPPTDTESSSSEQLETISFDSISSDEEILSQHSHKSKKHKHKKHKSKSTKKQHKGKSTAPQEENAAARAGLTVLDILELQARERAIRAQLQQYNQVSTEEPDAIEETAEKNDSSDEVEIKEEPAEVVEISSEDEKPKIEDLPVKPPSSSKEKATHNLSVNSTTLIKRSNDLIITVPQAKTARKIKLNRTKNSTITSTPDIAPKDKESMQIHTKNLNKKVAKETTEVINDKNKKKQSITENKTKSKKKQKNKAKNKEKEGSDHDEITLQLSDTEKMDLLDFDRKNYDNLTSSDSEDSDSSSESRSNDSEDNNTVDKSKENNEQGGGDNIESVGNKHNEQNDKNITSGDIVIIDLKKEQKQAEVIVSTNNEREKSQVYESGLVNLKDDEFKEKCVDMLNDSQNERKSPEKTNVVIEIVTDTEKDEEKLERNKENFSEKVSLDSKIVIDTNIDDKNDEKSSEKPNISIEHRSPKKNLSPSQNIEEQVEDGEITCEDERKLSDGEISENVLEVVCISDDEKNSKKKRKKEKKSKKDKKNKKSKSDFHEEGDQNFYKENHNKKKAIASNSTSVNYDSIDVHDENKIIIDDDKIVVDSDETVQEDKTVVDDDKIIVDDKIVMEDKKILVNDEKIIVNDDNFIDDDIYEILELSDDSSCYEVEGVSILSHIPTKAEIKALSAKIDEETHANEENKTDNEDIANISWRDRYLDSKKVKKVLTTANIFNALRKKNKELKKKLEETKNTEEIPEKSANEVEVDETEGSTNVIEGSIDHFNTLQGSTKYVDPIENKHGEVTKELEMDAKKLLKMYKRLLKHNDMYKEKEKDPNKKKKKKQKKNKEKKGQV